MASYPPESHYNLTRVVGKYLTYYVHRQVPPNGGDRVTVLDNERYVYRPDNLAFDLYGDERLWWVVPLRNGFQDPVFDLTFGRDLIIPDPAFVRSLI